MLEQLHFVLGGCVKDLYIIIIIIIIINIIICLARGD